MGQTIRDVLNLEAQIAEMVISTKAELMAEISQNALPNVTAVSPNVAVVKLQSLDQSILSPEYYISDSQARCVFAALKPATTASALFSKLEEMTEKCSAKVNGTTHRLNAATISVIKQYTP